MSLFYLGIKALLLVEILKLAVLIFSEVLTQCITAAVSL
jgi:hypothetical protein